MTIKTDTMTKQDCADYLAALTKPCTWYEDIDPEIDDDHHPEDCGECHGTGTVPKYPWLWEDCTHTPWIQEPETLSGYWQRYCPLCHGLKMVRRPMSAELDHDAEDALLEITSPILVDKNTCHSATGPYKATDAREARWRALVALHGGAEKTTTDTNKAIARLAAMERDCPCTAFPHLKDQMCGACLVTMTDDPEDGVIVHDHAPGCDNCTGSGRVPMFPSLREPCCWGPDGRGACIECWRESHYSLYTHRNCVCGGKQYRPVTYDPKARPVAPWLAGLLMSLPVGKPIPIDRDPATGEWNVDYDSTRVGDGESMDLIEALIDALDKATRT